MKGGVGLTSGLVPGRGGTSALDELGAFAAGLRLADLPPEVVEMARRCVLDTLGCGLYGSTTEEGRKVAAAVGAMDIDGRSGLWGTAWGASPPLAALANGASAHARELDDVNHAILHPGAVVVPAVLAVAEAEGGDGGTALAAIVAGYEVISRVSVALGPAAHRRLGWHGTATCGSVAAGLAAARMLGLGALETTWAGGLGGTAAGGLYAFLVDGAMVKRIHPGLAAQHGVVGAYLARERFSGPRFLFEAEDGFLHAFSDSPRPAELTAGLGERWDILRTHVKPYPACKAAHAPIEAVQAMRQEDGLRAEQVEAIVIRTTLTGKRTAGLERMPETILAAQMSTAYAVAVMLRYGSAGVEHYTEDRLGDPELRELVERVRVEADPLMDDWQRRHGTSPSRAVVRTRDGRTLERAVEYTFGMAEKPMTDAFVAEKYQANAGAAVSAERIEAIRATVARLEEIEDIRDLTKLLAAEERGAEPAERGANVRSRSGR